MDYFRRVITKSNEYGRDHLKNEEFGEEKWINSTSQYMLHLYGVVLRISIKPQNLGGYTCYF